VDQESANPKIDLKKVEDQTAGDMNEVDGRTPGLASIDGRSPGLVSVDGRSPGLMSLGGESNLPAEVPDNQN